ncbi:MAG TPA: ABC transporter ATP-binding protein [Hyphomicrobiales bacterium]|nr:ABC transporter ATP-binding protein [Hyphomicrobiales bacterium]
MLTRRLWSEHIRRYVPQLALAFVLISLLAATTGAYPLIIKYSFDMLSSGNTGFLGVIMAGIVVVTSTRGAIDYLQSYFTNRISIDLGLDLQKRLFQHILRLDYAQLTRDAPGQLMSRIGGDLGGIQGAVMSVFTTALRDALTVVALVVSMLYLDWVMTLLVMLIYPLAVIPIAAVGRIIRKNAYKTAQQSGATTSVLMELLSSPRLIKTFRLENFAMEKMAAEFDLVNRLRLKTVRVRSALNPILEVLGGIAVAAVIGFAAYRISRGYNTIGDFTGFVSALLMAAQPIRAFGSLNNRIQEGLASAERYYEVLTLEPSIVSTSHAKPLQLTSGEIRFEDVSFVYGSGLREAVRNFTLTVTPNSTVALVGRSGAGKSTIFNLVPRLYDVTSGRILIDGQDIRDVTVESLRDAMALVSQDITLFDDTVEANIRLGKLDASREEVIAAARAAAAEEFIDKLPMGYETLIGDRGQLLSGGQRQRLALARAILRNAPILLLDEATSALDAESERLVQQALAAFSRTRTTLVIAHRLATVKNADMICVMEEGRIVESGTHSELLARGGAYAAFCRSQMLTQENSPAEAEDLI